MALFHSTHRQSPTRGQPLVTPEDHPVGSSEAASAASHAHAGNWQDMTRTLAHYDVCEQIGEGTYGQVYRGVCKDTGRAVALKKMIIRHADILGLPPQLVREIKILKRLQHPNLLQLVEVVTSKGVEHLDPNDPLKSKSGKRPEKPIDKVAEAREAYKGNLFLVLEYVNHDLTGLLDIQHKFTPVQVKCILKQLFQALAYMHANKYIHRDIKSSNILLDDNFHLKLADFGLARSIEPPILEQFQGRSSSSFRNQPYSSSVSELTNKVITLWYRPPEILLGATEYGPAVDVWSAGCILAELMIGKPLFTGQNELQHWNAIIELLGTPSAETWKYLSTGLKKCRPSSKSKEDGTSADEPLLEMDLNYSNPSRLREKLSEKLAPAALNLLEKMLDWDPRKRVTAANALEHRYFWTQPVAPEDPAELGNVLPGVHFHEFQTKKKRKEAKAEAEAAKERVIAKGANPEQAKAKFDKVYQRMMKEVAATGFAQKQPNSMSAVEAATQKDPLPKSSRNHRREELARTNEDPANERRSSSNKKRTDAEDPDDEEGRRRGRGDQERRRSKERTARREKDTRRDNYREPRYMNEGPRGEDQHAPNHHPDEFPPRRDRDIDSRTAAARGGPDRGNEPNREGGDWPRGREREMLRGNEQRGERRERDVGGREPPRDWEGDRRLGNDWDRRRIDDDRPMDHGRNGPPDGPRMNRNDPGMDRDGPRMHRADPPFGRDGPRMDRGGPRIEMGMERDGPRRDWEGPPMDRGRPRMDRGGPRRDREGPHMDRGGPRDQMDRGDVPMDRESFRKDRDGPRMGRDAPDGPRRDTEAPGGDRFTDRESSRRDRDGPRRERDRPRMDADIPAMEPFMDREGSRRDRDGPRMGRDAPDMAPYMERDSFRRDQEGPRMGRDVSDMKPPMGTMDREGPGRDRDGPRRDRDGPDMDRFREREGQSRDRDMPRMGRDVADIDRYGARSDREKPRPNRNDPAMDREGNRMDRDERPVDSRGLDKEMADHDNVGLEEGSHRDMDRARKRDRSSERSSKSRSRHHKDRKKRKKSKDKGRDDRHRRDRGRRDRDRDRHHDRGHGSERDMPHGRDGGREVVGRDDPSFNPYGPGDGPRQGGMPPRGRHAQDDHGRYGRQGPHMDNGPREPRRDDWGPGDGRGRGPPGERHPQDRRHRGDRRR